MDSGGRSPLPGRPLPVQRLLLEAVDGMFEQGWGPRNLS